MINTELRNVLTVQVGDKVMIDTDVRTVTRVEIRPPREDEYERQVVMYFAETYETVHGDEGQDIRVVVE